MNILFSIYTISIITQVIIEIRTLPLAENGVIFRWIITYTEVIIAAASRFVDVPEEEINLMEENAIPRNTKHATKFGMTLFKVVLNVIKKPFKFQRKFCSEKWRCTRCIMQMS